MERAAAMTATEWVSAAGGLLCGGGGLQEVAVGLDMVEHTGEAEAARRCLDSSGFFLASSADPEVIPFPTSHALLSLYASPLSPDFHFNVHARFSFLCTCRFPLSFPCTRTHTNAHSLCRPSPRADIRLTKHLILLTRVALHPPSSRHPQVAQRANRILEGLVALRVKGLPPFFIWMYDDVWEITRLMWSRAEAIMGCKCVLEPTVRAFRRCRAVIDCVSLRSQEKP